MSDLTIIQGKRIVRLREVRTPMPPFVLIRWGIFDLKAGSRAKPLFVTFSRQLAAEIAMREGWRYVGPQEQPREPLA